jgi:hypothetical protein
LGDPRLSHLWLDAGYSGEKKGKGWVGNYLAPYNCL